MQDLQTLEEWVSVLDLATRWEFEAVRQGAIARLQEIASAVDRICIARQFDIEDWLKPTYIELCRRPSSLTLAENTKLGLETATLLADVRVKMRDHVLRYRHTFQPVQDDQIASWLDVVQREMLRNEPTGDIATDP